MTSVTTTCRDLSELTAAAQTACRHLFQECFKAGIVDIFITETFRSQARQNYLYEQGRTRPGQKVTWTLKVIIHHVEPGTLLLRLHETYMIFQHFQRWVRLLRS